MAEFMDNLFYDSEARAPDWLGEYRAAGRDVWEAAEWPTRKTEDWKYTSLRALQRDFEVAQPNARLGLNDKPKPVSDPMPGAQDGNRSRLNDEPEPVGESMQGTQDSVLPKLNDDPKPVGGSMPRAQASTRPVPGFNYSHPQLDGCSLVFVDGFWQQELSQPALPSGVELVRFGDAEESQRATILKHLGSVVGGSERGHLALGAAGGPERGHPALGTVGNRHLFAHLNDATLGDDGVFLRIAKGATMDAPIKLVWLSTTQDRPRAINQRLLVLAGTNSSASLVEYFGSVDGSARDGDDMDDSGGGGVGDGNGASDADHNGTNNGVPKDANGGATGNSDATRNTHSILSPRLTNPTFCPAFTNGLTELVLERGATLHHHRLLMERGDAVHIGGLYARLNQGSTLNSFHLALGSELKRTDIVVHHQEPGAHCNLNGIYLLRGAEHVDYHTCIEHAAPHCSTDEVFRGVVGDEANAVFNGRIHIHPGAAKTRAELNNRNLLTSRNAQVNTKPELEIYADDVRCAHGATVAQLDPDMLHYLRTRGVPMDEAQVMLSYGFIKEIADTVAIEKLREYLHPLLAQQLSQDDQLTRHLA